MSGGSVTARFGGCTSLGRALPRELEDVEVLLPARADKYRMAESPRTVTLGETQMKYERERIRSWNKVFALHMRERK